MTDDVVIRAEGLGKKYAVGHMAERGRYLALRDVLTRGAHNLWRKAAEMTRGRGFVAGDTIEEFWALRDVSFEVRRGEVLGIIGRNGAGKSTLLKILSRITEPTEGRVTINGRVASLLEVGTGFHPELTGRENIYLNGAILSMTHAEIRRKFDQIISFAEIEKFLDTPVKRYSSGMYVRLAFAVAAHLEPEILIVDEVLSVGDFSFQRKCLGKMEQVSRGEGRTVLFVSHQLDAVSTLCSRCVLLDQGIVLACGETGTVLKAYTGLSQTASVRTEFVDSNPPNVPAYVKSVRVGGAPIEFHSDIAIMVQYIVQEQVTGAVINFELMKDGRPILLSFDTDENPERLESRGPGCYVAEIRIPARLLKPGTYALTINTGRANSDVWQRLETCVQFDIDLLGRDSSHLSYAAKRPGLIASPLEWKTSLIAGTA